jgi:hypothetical protein
LPRNYDTFQFQRRRWPRAPRLIDKETDERRTSNIERPTSNNEFCLFYKTMALDFMKFHTSAAAGHAGGVASLIREET